MAIGTSREVTTSRVVSWRKSDLEAVIPDKLQLQMEGPQLAKARSDYNQAFW